MLCGRALPRLSCGLRTAGGLGACTRLRRRLGGRLLMDGLPHALQALIDFAFRPRDAFLAKVDRIRQQRAARLNPARVAAVLHLDALGLQELAKVRVELVFLYRSEEHT